MTSCKVLLEMRLMLVLFVVTITPPHCVVNQGFWYFRGRKITENHGNRPTLKIT